MSGPECRSVAAARGVLALLGSQCLPRGAFSCDAVAAAGWQAGCRLSSFPPGRPPGTMLGMLKAKVVRLEGVEAPCILLSPQGEMPEELVVDFEHASHAALAAKKGPITYRLQPSSADDPEPSYHELFEE